MTAASCARAIALDANGVTTVQPGQLATSATGLIAALQVVNLAVACGR